MLDIVLAFITGMVVGFVLERVSRNREMAQRISILAGAHEAAQKTRSALGSGNDQSR